MMTNPYPAYELSTELDKLIAVHILDGEFEGVYFSISDISVKEYDKIEYNYTIVKGDVAIKRGDEFKRVIHEIIYNLIESRLDGKPTE